jgi:inner membrane protein
MDRKPLTKLAGIAALTVILMAPLMLIQEQIANRSSFQEKVKEEIAQSAAGEQTLIGPVLAIRYRTQVAPGTYQNPETGETTRHYSARNEERILTLPAERLDIKGRANVEQRYRGIYQARLYHVEMTLDGNFSIPADLLPAPRHKGEEIEARAVLLLGFSDLNGLNSNPEATINNRTMRFRAPRDNVFDATLPGNRLEMELGRLTPGHANRIEFNFPLKLTGTEKFSIVPTAETNHIQLQSGWRHPSFQGRLPDDRQINGQGFTADWKVSRLTHALDAVLQANPSKLRGRDVLSVNFMEPVNIYLQAERAVKYGVIFIVLTFTAFLLWEILRRHPLHVMQYLLAGLALTIFFLLLIALSEHIPFMYAYLVSAAACIGLIVFYLSGALGGWSPALGFGAGLSSLYGILYGLLRSEDNALLMGSLLLFVALAAIMISTRRLDWHKLGNAPEAAEHQGEA